MLKFTLENEIVELIYFIENKIVRFPWGSIACEIELFLQSATRWTAKQCNFIYVKPRIRVQIQGSESEDPYPRIRIQGSESEDQNPRIRIQGSEY